MVTRMPSDADSISRGEKTPATDEGRSRPRRWIIAAAATIAMAIGVSITVYGYPPQGDSSDADLVYVIGPATPTRMQEAQFLLRSGDSGALLVSVAPPDSGGEFMASKMPICSQQSVTCVSPGPFTTKGEALTLNEYARTHEVHKVAVITITPHVARTRYIFARCAPGLDVQVIGIDGHLSLGDWAYQFAYQTTAFVKAAATPCASEDE